MLLGWAKNTALGLLVLGSLVVAALPGEGAEAREPAGGPPLTTRALRSLEPLVETESIRPTGRVRELTLIARPGRWELVRGVTVDTWAYNGQVPGPLIRATEGDTVRVTLVNELPEPTTIHWHGGHVPSAADGVAPFTQVAVQPGERFTYEFTAWHAGTFMYHTHHNSIEQTDRGLYGPLIIDPQEPSRQPRFDRDYTLMLSAWVVNEPRPAAGMHGMHGMPMHRTGRQDPAGAPGPAASGSGGGHGGHGGGSGSSMGYNYFTMNGKAFPDVEPLVVRRGDRVRLRLINISNLAHPMHLHGHDFRVIAVDGHPVPQPPVQNTIDVEPGRTYDVEFIADNPGVWVFHCHELHHTANGEVEPGGLIALVKYEDYEGYESHTGSAQGAGHAPGAASPGAAPSHGSGGRHGH